jgi:hypothetical protein
MQLEFYFHWLYITLAEPEAVRRISSITKAEENEFLGVNFEMVQEVCHDLQIDQERRQSLMYMQRLEPFLVSIQQFSETTHTIWVSFRVCLLWQMINQIRSILEQIRIPQLSKSDGNLFNSL